MVNGDSQGGSTQKAPRGRNILQISRVSSIDLGVLSVLVLVLLILF
jgi:hypothetical protein